MSVNVDFDVYEIQEKPEFKRLNQAIANCFELMYKSGLNAFEAIGVLDKAVGSAVYRAEIERDFSFDDDKLDYDPYFYFKKYAREHIKQQIGSTSGSKILGDMMKCINKILSEETTIYRNDE